jgi:hypothetical protein
MTSGERRKDRPLGWTSDGSGVSLPELLAKTLSCRGCREIPAPHQLGRKRMFLSFAAACGASSSTVDARLRA